MIAPNTGLIKDITNNKGDTTSSEENGTGKDVISAGGDSMRRNSECSDMRLYPGILSMTGRALCMLTCIPCIGSLLYGMDFGLTAWLLVNIETNAGDGMKWFEIVGDSDVGRGIVGSSSPFGMAVGCLFATLFAEKIGRKGLMLISALFYVTGCLVTCISGILTWQDVGGFCLLLAGRLLYGSGNAFVMISVPAYISETLPSRLRGACLSCMELFVVVGLAVGSGWAACGLFLWPEEASEDDARNLVWELRRGSGKKNITLFQQIKRGGAVAVAWKVSILLVAFQQLTGQFALLYYSGLLFTDSFCGVSASWGLSLIGTVRLAGAILCSFFVDEVGRRKLLVVSSCGMAVGMFFLALDFVTKLVQSPAAGPVCLGILVVAFYVYLFAFSLGLGPVTWILLGELYPVDVKSEASSWTLFILSMLNVLVSLLLPIVVKFLTFLGVFIMFFISCCICTFVMHLVVPETKGLTLEEIQFQLEASWKTARERLASLGPPTKARPKSFHGFDKPEEESERPSQHQRRRTHVDSFSSKEILSEENSPLLGKSTAF
eukprot:CAMPEP_0117857038 /NCGR_PEP_ID=MMETSP0950-20121206/1634_1 /TAXON_ID=44440 /ORGANISM="Chattonella subsalsa, Strain CCMP2191" /LENGTH=547 /DNA_ID=CAMNT_0005706313 /DNA_START=76 /DNA_END=1720 /DNA_ORIENTATION=+